MKKTELHPFIQKLINLLEENIVKEKDSDV